MRKRAEDPWLVLLLLVLFVVELADALECVQCDRRGAWFAPEDSERHIAKCQNGLIEPTKCLNSSHTHCIFSFYKQGSSSSIIVTERRCGVEEDILGCTLYKSSRRRMKRHFFGGATTASHSNSHKRRETGSLFVEVCTEGCIGDGCISTAIRPLTAYTLTILMLLCPLILRVIN
ncbi:hypothetical protein M3Y97_00370900 [Aphelenchoides bicaudatus]|nr:hypothetical protein M3Y97_00370900 [Aphelenchoides bicaudatus]